MFSCPSISWPFFLPTFILFQCVARKVPELCKAYTPGKADQDINARLSRLEQIIEMAMPQYCSSGSLNLFTEMSNDRRRSMSPAEDDNRSQTEEQDPSGGTFQSGKWYGNSALGSVAPASVLEQVRLSVQLLKLWLILSN